MVENYVYAKKKLRNDGDLSLPMGEDLGDSGINDTFLHYAFFLLEIFKFFLVDVILNFFLV